MLPTLFLSHGAPTLVFDDIPARSFIAQLGGDIPRPDAILIVSAHWETEIATVNMVDRNETIHDFYGFPRPLFDLTYPAPGAPTLGEHIVDLLGAAGIPCRQDHQRGLDHGAWVPLMLMYPNHDIPVLQLSVQPRLGPGHHLQVGRALAALREENILVIGSGSFTHNLGEVDWSGTAPEAAWVTEFCTWFDQRLIEGRTCDLLAYRQLAPHAVRSHPTDEHLLPLFVALGAAGGKPEASRIHQSLSHGSLRMDAYAFA